MDTSLIGGIATILVCIGASLLFVVLSQNRGSFAHGIPALIFGSALLTMIGFFLLPWVVVRDGLDSMIGLLNLPISSEAMVQFEQLGVMEELKRIARESTQITGWRMASGLVTVTGLLQFTLFAVPLVSLLGLVSGAMAITKPKSVRVVGLFLTIISSVIVTMVFFSLPLIRGFGVDIGFFIPLLDVVGIRLGPGVWVSLVGLAMLTISGVWLMITVNKVQPQSRQRNIATRRRSRRVR